MPMGIGLGIGVTRGGGVGWWPAGSELALEFDNQRGFNSIDRTKTTPDSILTYTNPSAKLVYGSDGVLRYANHNLLLQSQTLDSGTWVKTNVSVVNTADVVAPDGTLTADKIENTINAPTGGAQLIQTLTTLGTGTYAYSVYAKIGSGAADSNRFVVRNNTTAVNAVSLTIDWSTGAITQITGSGATATSAGDGWWRIVMPFSLTATVGDSIRFFVGVTGQVESVGEFIYAWGAQLQITPNHSNTYIPTTTAAVYSLPIDHNPTTFEPLGVLIEEQRINLLLQSQTLGTTWLSSDFVSVGANTATAPDGTVTADTIIPDTSTNRHSLFQNPTVSASTAYTYSGYFKAAGYTKGALRDGVSTAAYVSFDLSNGTILDSGAGTGTNLSTSITPVGNGWYRVTLTITTTSVQTAFGCRIYVLDPTYTTGVVTGTWTPNGTSGIYVWGAQLEAGAFATSYIPTVASQVTRAADQVSILTSAFGYNAAAGSYAVEAGGQFTAGTITTWFRDDNIVLTNTASGVRVYNSASSSLALLGSYTPGTTAKVAVGYMSGASASAGSIAGAAVVTFTNPGDTATTLLLGRGNSGVGQFQLNGHIKRLTYFPTRRSNADLQVLTT